MTFLAPFDLANASFELTLQYLRAFVIEWFDQNPLGQVGVIVLRDRLAETLIPMGGGLECNEAYARQSTRDHHSIV